MAEIYKICPHKTKPKSKHCHKKILFKVNNTLYVDSRYGHDATAQPDSPTCPYQTLLAAITAAPLEAVIYLRPGHYLGQGSLLNKNLYAETGATIHMRDSALFSGAINVDGHADIVIDFPIPYMHFRLANMYNNTNFNCNSVTDVASTLATFSLTVPPTQSLNIKIQNSISFSSPNLHGVFYVNIVTTTVAKTVVYVPLIVSTIPTNNIIRTYGNFTITIDNVITPGRVIDIILGTNVINIGNIGNLSNYASNALTVADGQNTVKIDTMYCQTGLIINGGRNVFNIINMGTSSGLLNLGIDLQATTGYNVFNISKIFAKTIAVKIVTPPQGLNYILNIATIGNADVYSLIGLEVINNTDAIHNSNITVNISNIYAYTSGLTVSDLTPARGRLLLKGFIASLAAVEQVPLGVIEMDSVTTSLLLNIPNLLVDSLVNAGVKPAINLLNGICKLNINNMKGGGLVIHSGLSTEFTSEFNSVQCHRFLVLDGNNATVNINGNIVKTDEQAIKLFATNSVINLNLKSLTSFQDCLLIDNYGSMNIKYSGDLMQSGINYALVRNTTSATLLVSIVEAISDTLHAIVLDGPTGADNTFSGLFNNVGGHNIIVVNNTTQKLTLKNAVLRGLSSAIVWPGISVCQLNVFGVLTTTVPTDEPGTNPGIIKPAGAIILADNIF